MRFGIIGAGVIADVVKQWNEGRKPGPVANQLRSLQAMVTGLTTVSSTSEVVLNGKALSIYGLLVTTLDRLLFGSRPYWGQTDPGSLKITWVEAAAEHLLRHAPALLRGRSSLADRKGFESHRIDRATLELEGPYIIDGEIFEPRNRILNIETSHPIRWIRL